MRTYWLTGLRVVDLDNDDGDDDDGFCIKTGQPFDENDFSLENLKENGLQDDDSSIEEIQGTNNGVGKISVADSGICMDKSITVAEERDQCNTDKLSGGIYRNNAHEILVQEGQMDETFTGIHDDHTLNFKENYKKLHAINVAEFQERAIPNTETLLQINDTDRKENTTIRFNVLPKEN